MGDITIGEIFEYGSKLTVTVLLALVLVGGKLKWWRFGYQFDELRADLQARLDDMQDRLTDKEQQLAEEKADAEEWKQLALRNITVVQTQAKALPAARVDPVSAPSDGV